MALRKTQYGIIGHPLDHSLSPVMHNAAFKALGVDAEYKLLPLEEHELDEFFKGLRDVDSPIFGLNVTVPYKEKVLKYIDSVAPLAGKIGAVNTITINKNRKSVGHNTDAPGFLAHLAELGVTTDDKQIALLGAGGSARAILASLCLIPERPGSIAVYNRNAERLENLLNEMREKFDATIIRPVDSVDELNMRECDILINTTSVGLNEEDAPLVDASLVHPDLFVYDLIYNPSETALLKLAREAGAKTSNGLGMLFYQGVLAFGHWAGGPVNEKVKAVMRNALEEAVGL